MKGTDTIHGFSSHFSLFTNSFQLQIPAAPRRRGLLAVASIWPRSRAGQARPGALGSLGPLDQPSTID